MVEITIVFQRKQVPIPPSFPVKTRICRSNIIAQPNKHSLFEMKGKIVTGRDDCTFRFGLNIKQFNNSITKISPCGPSSFGIWKMSGKHISM